MSKLVASVMAEVRCLVGERLPDDEEAVAARG